MCAFDWITRDREMIRPTLRLYSRRGKVVEIVMDTMHEADFAAANQMATILANLIRMLEIDGYFLASLGRDGLLVAAANHQDYGIVRYPIKRNRPGVVVGFGEPEADPWASSRNPLLLDLFQVT
jgi:hypothetical protein